jgi:hypothetical protein
MRVSTIINKMERAFKTYVHVHDVGKLGADEKKVFIKFSDENTVMYPDEYWMN